MENILLVFLGGGLGATARYAAGQMASRLGQSGFPWGTWGINVGGSFLMGVLIGILALRGEHNTPWRLLLGTGFLGGFTTFSAFTLEIMLLWENHHPLNALVYAGSSVAVSLLGLFLGLWLTRTLF